MISKTLKQVSYQRLTQSGNSWESVASDLTSFFGYDALGNLTTMTDASGATSYCYYDALGALQHSKAAVNYTQKMHNTLYLESSQPGESTDTTPPL